ncbi:MAG: PDZ domain-containing protein [Peptococcaceae bacterium]|nr:PDZ domain-containing protein [Peptococcaceae bacterium]
MDMLDLEEVISDVKLFYIKEPDQDTMVRGAIEGLLESLKDPYTEYLSPEDLKYFKSSVEGDYVGIGVQIQPAGDYPKVVNTIEGTPASAAGIKPGDLVVKVNGRDIAGEPLGKVVGEITGEAGTKVRLTIRREGLKDIDLELVRSNISTPTVTSSVVEGEIGLIRIKIFGESTEDEFQKALDDLISKGVKKLILDLRDNPGGMLESAVDITSDFVEPGQVAVSTVDRSGRREEYLTEGTPAGKDMPIVVLVDEYSASASEALAGALQDYGHATLIGGKTYGKGTVQVVIPLSAGGVLKITTAKYHTPKDRVIDGTGLMPDIQVLTPYLPQAVAQRYLKNADTNIITLEVGKNGSTVNGTEVKSGRVIQQEGASYLPLRLMFEALGYRVDWQQGDGSIKVTGFQKEAIFHPGGGRFTINGHDYPQGAPLLTIDGETYVRDTVFSLFDISQKQEGSKITFEKKP